MICCGHLGYLRRHSPESQRLLVQQQCEALWCKGGAVSRPWPNMGDDSVMVLTCREGKWATLSQCWWATRALSHLSTSQTFTPVPSCHPHTMEAAASGTPPTPARHQKSCPSQLPLEPCTAQAGVHLSITCKSLSTPHCNHVQAPEVRFAIPTCSACMRVCMQCHTLHFAFGRATAQSCCSTAWHGSGIIFKERWGLPHYMQRLLPSAESSGWWPSTEKYHTCAHVSVVRMCNMQRHLSAALHLNCPGGAGMDSSHHLCTLCSVGPVNTGTRPEARPPANFSCLRQMAGCSQLQRLQALLPLGKVLTLLSPPIMRPLRMRSVWTHRNTSLCTVGADLTTLMIS